MTVATLVHKPSDEFVNKESTAYWCGHCMMRQLGKIKPVCQWCGASFSNYIEVKSQAVIHGKRAEEQLSMDLDEWR